MERWAGVAGRPVPSGGSTREINKDTGSQVAGSLETTAKLTTESQSINGCGCSGLAEATVLGGK